MRKYFILAVLLCLAVSCSKPAAKVNLNLKEGVSTNVELYKLDVNRLSFVDSLNTDKAGRLNYRIALSDAKNPAFYYFYHNATKLAGMVVSDGDRISISADTLGRYEVEGSDDCRLLKEMDGRLAENIAKMERILAEAPEDENAQLSRIYIDHKRALMRQVIENPFSITSAAALFQKFNDQLYVFQEPTDIYIFKNIRDSLATRYPDNPYVAALTKTIDERKNFDDLAAMINEKAVVGIPEIEMNDINGQPNKISDLNGQVILLSFWSTSQDEHTIFNQELVPIYDKYHSRGFEIYQICVDEKPVWANIVRNQNLPWICVNDGLGINSPAVAAYHLNSIPPMFIIGRDSDILAKDVYDPAVIESIIQKNL